MNNPSSSWLGSLAIASAVGSALAAGVFFAFSTFVMPALARMQPREGLAAMQAINVAAVNPWLMTLLFGTGALMAAVAVAALRGGGWPAALAGAAAAVYIVGVLGMTMAFHVPRNEALASVALADADAPACFASYLASWVPGNHVRALAGAIASVLLFASASGWRAAGAQNMMPM